MTLAASLVKQSRCTLPRAPLARNGVLVHAGWRQPCRDAAEATKDRRGSGGVSDQIGALVGVVAAKVVRC
jgi:hypothetical protein